MSLLRLSLLVTVLAVSVLLAQTNPTTDQYLSFVQAELTKAIGRIDPSVPEREGAVVRSIFRQHSEELLNSMVRPHTVRQNWGLFSRFESRVLGTRIVVIGVCRQFIPIEGVDEAVLTLGRNIF